MLFYCLDWEGQGSGKEQFLSWCKLEMEAVSSTLGTEKDRAQSRVCSVSWAGEATTPLQGFAESPASVTESTPLLYIYGFRYFTPRSLEDFME